MRLVGKISVRDVLNYKCQPHICLIISCEILLFALLRCFHFYFHHKRLLFRPTFRDVCSCAMFVAHFYSLQNTLTTSSLTIAYGKRAQQFHTLVFVSKHLLASIYIYMNLHITLS